MRLHIVLDRIQNFLPQMQAANEALGEAKAEDLNIENLQDEESFIEMARPYVDCTV